MKNNRRDQIKDFYCCDCVFEKVMYLMEEKDWESYSIFEEKMFKAFPSGLLLISFKKDGISVIICKKTFNFLHKVSNEYLQCFPCLSDRTKIFFSVCSKCKKYLLETISDRMIKIKYD